MKYDFENVLRKIKRLDRRKEIGILNETLIQFIKHIKRVQKELNNDEKVIIYILNEFREHLKEYLKIGKNSMMKKELEALSVFKGNPHILIKYYKLLKDKDLENFNKIEEREQLNGNAEEREMYEAKIIIQEARKHKSHISPEMIQRVKKEYAKQKVKTAEMKEYYNYYNIFGQETEEEMIKLYVEYRKKELDKLHKKQEVQKLMQTGKILKKYGLLENALLRMNTDYEFMDMPELKYQMRANEEGDIGVEDIFEEEYLKGLNQEQLAILNSFWQNRLTKELQVINQAVLTIQSLNLWGDILQGKEIKPISEEELRNIIYKSKICYFCYQDIKKAGILRKEKHDDTVWGELNVNVIDYNFRESYCNYFSQIFPEDRNKFLDDFILTQANRNLIEIIYDTKDYKLNELLLNIERNSRITNWGYMPEKFKGKNSLQRQEKQVIIAIDYPGFNNTLELHRPREQLIEYFLKVKERTVIPIYEGQEAERYEGKIRSRQILVPLTEKREKAIIALSKNVNATDPRYQYIAHLGNLITKKLRKKIKKIYPSRYVDLLTGEEGYIINDKFVSEQEKSVQEESEKNIDN